MDEKKFDNFLTNFNTTDIWHYFKSKSGFLPNLLRLFTYKSENKVNSFKMFTFIYFLALREQKTIQFYLSGGYFKLKLSIVEKLLQNILFIGILALM